MKKIALTFILFVYLSLLNYKYTRVLKKFGESMCIQILESEIKNKVILDINEDIFTLSYQIKQNRVRIFFELLQNERHLKEPDFSFNLN